jgi:plastocyanin
MKRLIIVGVALFASGIIAAACASGVAKVPAGERVFYVNAIEIKGSTSTTQLAPPTVNPETLSKGLVFKAPGIYDNADPTRWEVSSYQFNPSAMTVFQGDRVKLVLFVVNGNKHKDSVIDPDGVVIVPETEHNRGRLYEIKFTADKAGFYELNCQEHNATMRAIITVIPR